ncbi:histidine kinase [Leptospira yasudae]|uniref:response regulator n=1 Tax=Leptospira yasudae TaxID=2202201 RepID=UPI000E59F537|nr:response regulator [Leptospira yasudae]RHX93253.1 histidine kinase [Leptospira yasudae]
MTIRTRLIIGFGIVLTILAISSVFMIEMLADSSERLGRIVDVSAKKVSLSNEILIHVLDSARHEKNIIIETDSVKMNFYKDRIYKSVDLVDQKIVELQAYSDADGLRLLEDFKTTWNEYRNDLNQIVFLALKNENDKAFVISIRKGLVMRDLVTKQLSLLVKRNEDKMQEEKNANQSRYYVSLSFLIFLLILSIGSAVAVSYWIVDAIGKRIRFIAGVAEKIASREFSETKFEAFTNDELQPVYDSLNNIHKSFQDVTDNAKHVASGNYQIDFVPKSEKDLLGTSLRMMTSYLRKTTQENEKHNWITNGQNLLNEKMRGDRLEADLATELITFLCNYLNSSIGALYLCDDRERSLSIFGRYGFASADPSSEKYFFGEGLIGQSAVEQKRILLTEMEEESIRVRSSIVDTKPRQILIVPFLFENKTIGVIELGKLDVFSSTEIEFLTASTDLIGIIFNSSAARRRIGDLLEETQVQGEELQSQQEELKQVNEELEEQTQILRQQQEELRVSNEELEEQTRVLEAKNREVESAKYDVEQKSRQLELSSRYKSEFLANMSHELRTPLNSLLILSKDLADNKKKNLNSDQVESANIIYKSGHDLLLLINEVLDLSKIESGKMSTNVERVVLQKFCDELLSGFKHQASERKLELSLILHENLPEAIRTDSLRLNQILKNLLSNALKFTERGGIRLEIERDEPEGILFSVIDTGIGIPEDKHAAVFEAFQQADGSTSRKYGGTGLGLSISRELAKLLGGSLTLQSKINEGSTFALRIPIEIDAQTSPAKEERKFVPASTSFSNERRNEFLNYPAVEDDKNEIEEGDKILLIVEDDLKFASILVKQAREKGFKCISAATGEDGLAFARRYKPHAILLDLDLPGINGHTVLNELKTDQSVRHIPVHIVSVNEYSLELIREGAVEYIRKPVNKKQIEEAFNRIESFINRKMKNLLIIEDDENSRKAMRKLIGNGDVKCFEAGTGKEAVQMYRENYFDCIVLDIGLPDMSGFDLIYEMEKIKGQHIPPIIIYTGRELTKEENGELQKYAESIIIKGIKSEERLLDETALFLHRTIRNLPESKRSIINSLYDKDSLFQGKKVLLVDDDMRNIFALSKILSERGMTVLKAENGKNAIEILHKNEDADLILMDIMMPEMDGYEAMRRIRENTKYKDIIILALTAKAMKDDKRKCIEAGANDYISKPVDVERLLSLMRVWLSK